MNVYVIAFLLPCLLSLILTPFCARLAGRFGFIAHPHPRGWHQQPTPLLGGAALLISFTAGLGWSLPKDQRCYPLLWGAVLSFLLGLIDDRCHLRPLAKLLGQIAVAWIAIPSHSPIVVAFVVLMMNAFNLLDNIDGLAAGVAMIISLGLAGIGFLSLQEGLAVTGLALAGGTAGFLFYNFPPAKIFMGDCGSLLLGFCVSFESAKLLAPSPFPLLILLSLLAVPLMDTLFVIYSRLKRGKSIIEGGQDHLSHWFFSRGLSARKTVIILYSITLATSLTGFLLEALTR